jgi:thymidylate synthase ThyX
VSVTCLRRLDVSYCQQVVICGGKYSGSADEIDGTAEKKERVGAAVGDKAQVYCLAGVDPEVHAYAMAKYSRSALSMRQALQELSQQRAEQFLNTFYFQYGHRSIADLAHLSFAIEHVSMLAAIAIVDEPRWDGQERSSRYQDFKNSGYFLPAVPEGMQGEFVRVIDGLFDEYSTLSEASSEYLGRSTPKPASMQESAYKRTIRARAFDIARYLLPLATNTSVGQIVSARTLENQISRLAADSHPEVRRIATLLKESATAAPYNLRVERLETLLGELQKRHPEVDGSELAGLLSNPPIAPTLVKYAEAKPHEEARAVELTEMAASLLRNAELEPSDSVTLVRPPTLEIEVAATLLYEHSHHSYRQIVDIVSDLSSRTRQEIIALGVKYRGPFDEVSRSYAAGQGFQFDLLMDIGGFRDMHRHRRCVQILQRYTAVHGYVIPEQVEAVGRAASFRSRMNECQELWQKIGESEEPALRSSRDYLLPLAFRRRALFKMDLAEVIYICELRTSPGGHFSYRQVAYEMYLVIKRLYPEIGGHMRVHDVHANVGLLDR